MLIPVFPLPSRPKQRILFRMPTVDDAIYFCKSTEATEERDTTEYLNQLQEKDKLSDSRSWTASDRRTALWWIFINSRADTIIDFSYTCQHCGEEHWYNCDVYHLSRELNVLTTQPFVEATIPVDGQPYDWSLSPLDGYAMERLEIMRAALPPTSKQDDYKEALTLLRKWELVYQAKLVYDLEPDYDKSAQNRFELIGKMAVGTELLALAKEVKSMQYELQHGLNIRFDKGESDLVLPPHECYSDKYKEAAERPTTRLLTRFRNSLFIPNIGTGLLADVSLQPGVIWPATAPRHTANVG
ncbi:morphogenetic protein [Pseudocitrobacter sp. RIT415]|uniref:morphogenetic protein n=1 Tax=Pseudocitrobacter sp. RIT415 TaxID=2202163 RepID=UPI0011BDDF66|nr:morphogenetic protein [Pseudocitrobacter sp. RIT 415]